MVEQILSGESRETIVENIHTKLMEVGEKVRDGKIPVELYYITKVYSFIAHLSERLKWAFLIKICPSSLALL